MSDLSDSPRWITTAPLAIGTVVEPIVTQEHDALHPGTRLDEFEILRVLGAGGFGIVYLALDHVLMRQVAIKEYMPTALAARGKGAIVSVRSATLADTFATGLNSFFNEAQLLASFDHPALVKVHRFWKANGTAYMVMPYYAGQTLKDVRTAMPGAPDEAWLRALLEPLLGALALLHREGVYHRDIAPDNILLLPDGRPVLLDFGSARRVIGDRTQALTAILKPNFAPIEQYADEAGMKQGPWTDLYALGATIHYALTGHAPTPAVMRAVRDPMPALSLPGGEHFPGVSELFLAAIDWTLAVAPEERPQSVASMREALSGEVLPPVPSARYTEPRLAAEPEPGRGSRRLGRAGAASASGAAHDLEIVARVPGTATAAMGGTTAATATTATTATAGTAAATAASADSADSATSAAEASARLSPPPARTQRAFAALVALFALIVLAWGSWALIPSAAVESSAAAASADARLADVRNTPPAQPVPTQGRTRPPDPPPPAPRTPPAVATPVAAPRVAAPRVAAPRVATSPVAATRAAAVAHSPKQVCAGLNFFAGRICLGRTCETAAWRTHPQCVELRRVEAERREQMARF